MSNNTNTVQPQPQQQKQEGVTVVIKPPHQKKRTKCVFERRKRERKNRGD